MANTVNDVHSSAGMFVVMPSADRTATPDTVEYQNLRSVDGLIVVVNVSALTATGTLVAKVQGVDPVSGATWDILTSASIATTGTTVLRVGPGITAATNVAVSDLVPAVVRILVTAGNSVSITYSVSAQFLH